MLIDPAASMVQIGLWMARTRRIPNGNPSVAPDIVRRTINVLGLIAESLEVYYALALKQAVGDDAAAGASFYWIERTQ
jgi:hypothetical protein